MLRHNTLGLHDSDSIFMSANLEVDLALPRFLHAVGEQRLEEARVRGEQHRTESAEGEHHASTRKTLASVMEAQVTAQAKHKTPNNQVARHA